MSSDAQDPIQNNQVETSRYDDLTQEEKEDIYRRARKKAIAKTAFMVHASAFLLVMSLLILINLVASPGTWWFVYPLLIWGAGLGFHWALGVRFIDAYRKLEDKEIAKEIERTLSES